MGNSGKSFRTAALVCALLLTGGVTQAADTQPVYDLGEVVVTATRIAENKQAVPASVSVVTAKDIAERNVRTPTEAIAMLPGVYDARPQGMSDVGSGIMMRGYSEDDILVLYDGVPLNNGYDGKIDWNAVAINDIAKIEMVRGAASSLYGGRAVGGVINIISKQPKAGTHGKAYVSYGSNTTWKRGVNVSAQATDKLSFGFGYENRRTDGVKKKLTYKRPNTATSKPKGPIGTGAELTQNYSGTPIYVIGYPGTGASKDNTYNFKMRYAFSDTKSLTYHYTHDSYKYYAKGPHTYIHDADGNPLFNGSALLPNGKYLNFSESDFTDYYGRRKTDIHNFNYQDTKNQLFINAGLTNIKDSGYSTGPDFDGQKPGNDARYPSKSYKMDLQKTWEIGKNTLVSGFDIQRDSMVYTKKSLAHWHNWHSGTRTNLQVGGKNLITSLFIQDKYALSDKWDMYAGLRFDHYKKYGGFYKGTDNGKTTGNYMHIRQEDKTYNELSPKLSFEYKPDENSTYYISYGHSFKAPSLYQLYRHDPQYGYISNPGLDPEKTNTYEIGMKKKWGKTEVDASVYHAKTKDMIIASDKDANGYRRYINEDEAKRKGFEMEVRHSFNDVLSAYANYAFEDAKGKDGRRLYSIPRHIVHAGINYQRPQWNAYLESQYVSSRNKPGQVAHRLYSEDAVYTINLGANYEFAKGATLGFAVNNLLDRDYWAWQYAAGRTYTVTLSYEF